MSQNLELRPRKCIFLGGYFHHWHHFKLHNAWWYFKVKFQLVLMVLPFSTGHASPLLPVSSTASGTPSSGG